MVFEAKGHGLVAEAKGSRLKRIKQQIQAGTYQTKQKLLTAVKRLLKDLPNYDKSGRRRR